MAGAHLGRGGVNPSRGRFAALRIDRAAGQWPELLRRVIGKLFKTEVRAQLMAGVTG
jgi:hypothetical protein